MAAFAVVVDLEVVLEVLTGVVKIGEGLLLQEELGFDVPEGALYARVMVGVAFAGHALVQAVPGQKIAELGAPVLAPAIGVEVQPRWSIPLTNSVLQWLADQLGAQVGRQLPADDLARVQVDDDGEVNPAAAGQGEVGNVAGPGVVGGSGVTSEQEQVRPGREGLAIAGAGARRAGLDGDKALAGHEAAHGADTDRQALALKEFRMNAPDAIAALMLVENLGDLGAKLLIFNGFWAGRMVAGVVGAGGQAEGAADQAHGVSWLAADNLR